jgi:DNA-binding response OmpR family regulator
MRNVQPSKLKSIVVIEEERQALVNTCNMLADSFRESYIHGFSEPLEGFHWTRTETPEVVVMDVAFTEWDGVRLAREMLMLHPSLRILIVTALPPNGLDCLTSSQHKRMGFLPKPFDRAELQRRVEDLMREGPISFITGFDPRGLVQFIHQECKSCRVRVSDHGISGELQFRDGMLYHARCGNNVGRHALHRLLQLPNPTFEIYDLPHDDAANITGDVTALLLEHCYARDHEERERALARIMVDEPEAVSEFV